ncbi:MAG: hypothetical protein KDK78_04680 [Chlamydiia bacterium]|nr:hypothetical protein [Chlamydiia bacterium]
MAGRWVVNCVLIPLAASCFLGASLHPNTSMDPKTKILTLKIPDDIIQVNLDSPGVEVYYFPDHTLRRVVYYQLNKQIDIRFHHTGVPAMERVAQIKRFSIVDENFYLDGASQTFDLDGHLITESNWIQGLMDGAQRVLNKEQIVRDLRYYERGFPVGRWEQRYADGTLASEINFPASYSDWMALRGTTPELTGRASLADHVPPKRETTLGVWYNQSGIKQAECEYFVSCDGSKAIIARSGNARIFDHDGQVVRETKLVNGTGWELRQLEAEEGRYEEKTVWINGEVIQKRDTFFQKR